MSDAQVIQMHEECNCTIAMAMRMLSEMRGDIPEREQELIRESLRIGFTEGFEKGVMAR